jgi:predicted dinucleotide-binding enzyme
MTLGGPGLAGVMTTIGFIGSGMIGGTVARLSLAAGHRVVMSNSRGPETLQYLVAELGPLATAATAGQAAEAGDLVVVSIPVKAIGDVPAKPLAGKPVLDTGNYYPQRDGQIEVLDTGALTSSGLLQRHLPDAHVVKVFNNIYYKHLESLARPSGAPDRTALPIAADDAAARAAVTAYLDSIGYDAVDTGTLADSWRQEPGTPVYGAPYGPFSSQTGHPADAATILAALAAAHRSRPLPGCQAQRVLRLNRFSGLSRRLSRGLSLSHAGSDLVHVEGLGLGDQLLERLFRQRARLGEQHDVVADDHQGGDGGDVEGRGHLGLRLGVDLAEHRVRVLLGRLLEDRPEHPARRAPLGPEVD